MLSTILLQAAAGMGVAKMGATIGAGFAAIGAGIGIGLKVPLKLLDASRRPQERSVPRC